MKYIIEQKQIEKKIPFFFCFLQPQKKMLSFFASLCLCHKWIRKTGLSFILNVDKSHR